MPSEKHREAEELSVAAAKEMAEGRLDDALKLYARAAELERAALEAIPAEKSRTRSILSVSVASLLYKAQMFEEAEIAIFRSLASQELLSWADLQLRELLQVVADERILAAELASRYSGESITVALRGGEIGRGTGPLDLILEKASGFRSLLYRFAEWIGEYPIRFRGNPPKELQKLVQARATEPAIGSYRLEIRLTEPIQPDLFESSRVQPEAISDTLFQFMDSLTAGDSAQLEQLIPQNDYRKALLQLTGTVTPRGRRIDEIAIYRKHHGKLQKVSLTEALPPRIREYTPTEPKHPEAERVEIRGVLRALHLDKAWLELVLPDEKHEKCYTVPDMLDDVVGPMVNREVVARGPMIAKRHVTRLLVEEIELAEED